MLERETKIGKKRDKKTTCKKRDKKEIRI